ncbi:MAG: hypothetical protein HC835_11145 [Oscillatoriales cyanobacterium RM2_1_1]|nr:hypothetical protein [Oscillatoriales cyanobacterium SM2_3_0]NJO46130.1 hypothetical protein [Oscillatoriales cyanobacterium RM2_1_1]
MTINLLPTIQTPLSLAFSAITLSFLGTVPVQAASLTYSGDTTNGPTFNRPAAPGFEGLNDPITELSGNGTAVPFFSQGFSVEAAGFYDVIGTQNFDGLQFLYQDGFDPINPLTNLLVGSDSFPDPGNSSFMDLSLMADTQYFLVTTGFDNTDISFGSFTNTITGPGNIALAADPKPVPEPSMILGTVFSLVYSRLLLKRQLKQQGQP